MGRMPNIGAGGPGHLERVLGLMAYAEAAVGNPKVKEPAPAVVQPDASMGSESLQQRPGFDPATGQRQVM
jgi:hypothetical protein